jgi:moderate conductance mechanosensitive channel
MPVLSLKRSLCCLALMLAVFAVAVPANAQTESGPVTAVELPDPLTGDAIEALVSRLSDAEVRALLLQQLGTVAETPGPDAADGPADPVASVLARVVATFAATGKAIAATIRGLPETLGAQAQVFGDIATTLGPRGQGMFVIVFLGALLAGFAARAAFARLYSLRGTRVDAAHGPDEPSFPQVMRRPLRGLMRDMTGAVVFFLAMMPDGMAVNAQMIAFWLVMVPQVGHAILTSVLEPARA